MRQGSPQFRPRGRDPWETPTPIIDVSMLQGRSDDMKPEIIRAVTAAFCRVAGNHPDTVRVIRRDVPHANWDAGGVPKEKP